MNRQFEWDENKNRININKHGIDFSNVVAVFDNPYLERIDDRFEYGETRSILLGEIEGIGIVVVYTNRKE